MGFWRVPFGVDDQPSFVSGESFLHANAPNEGNEPPLECCI